jgi:hypothetical protein
MVKRLPIFLLILSTPAAFAQLDSNSVTVSATRSLAQQPDQVLFGVTVQSGLNTSLDDVVCGVARFGDHGSELFGGYGAICWQSDSAAAADRHTDASMDIRIAGTSCKNQRYDRDAHWLTAAHRSAEQRADFVVQRSGNSSFRAIAAVAGLPDIGPACRRNRAGTKASWRRGAQSRSHTGDIQRNIRSRQCRFCSLNCRGAYICAASSSVGLLYDCKVCTLAVLRRSIKMLDLAIVLVQTGTPQFQAYCAMGSAPH